jgi:hypothetical protein
MYGKKGQVRKCESHMTYLAGFIVIAVKGLCHSDWQGARLVASPKTLSFSNEKWKNSHFLHFFGK